jgi:hypothetical protein
MKFKPTILFPIAIAAVLAVAGLGLAGRSIWTKVRGLEGLRAAGETLAISTSTPVPPAVARAERTLVRPAAPPTPSLREGWRIAQDPFTGDDYLAPPPEVEAAVRAAFQAVLAMEVIEDRPDEEALQFDLGAAYGRLVEMADPRFAEYYQADDMTWLGRLGPENPVRCQDYDRCAVGRAKLGTAGAVIDNPETCAALNEGIPPETQAGNFLMAGDGSHCVTRFIADEAPHVIYYATVERQEDGEWIVTGWEPEEIASPPSAGS